MPKPDYFDEHRLVFRASREPTAALPFGVRSAGAYRVRRGWHEPVKVKPFVQLFWTVSGRGSLVYRGGPVDLPEGFVSLYLPGDVHDVTAVSEVWTYRWFTFDGPLSAATALSFGLDRRPRQAGACPEARFERRIEEIQDPTPGGQARAAVTGFALLAQATGHVEGGGTAAVSGSCRSLAAAMLGSPDLDVASLAARLGLHRSTLSRAFRRETGMTLVHYLCSVRVAEAARLLRSTRLGMAAVAARCGFRDPNYFCRVFSRAFGLPPREFRRNGEAPSGAGLTTFRFSRPSASGTGRSP